MINFGSTGIVAGYIKQLLASFNLPTVRIHTRSQLEASEINLSAGIKEYYERYDILESSAADPTSRYNTAHCYIPYIKEGKLQIYINGIWKDLSYLDTNPHRHYYERGNSIPYWTKTLRIRDNVYDSYTHEYLGNYLRFIRDFDGIDLMPLYNCFSNRLCENLELSFLDYLSGNTINFNTSDTSYKIYMLPLKLFKDYTLALDSESMTELCCGIYGAYLDTSNSYAKLLPASTYTKYAGTQFSKPLLYEDIMRKLCPLFYDVKADKQSIEYREQVRFSQYLAQHEDDLKLFIKVPATVDSSIVVLEGDYTTWNNFIIDAQESRAADHQSGTLKTVNRTVISNELIKSNTDIPLITSLQLLRLNTKKQAPFSDRLLEYLLENVITPTDEISNNVKLAQMVVSDFYDRADMTRTNDRVLFKYSPGFLGLWDTQLKQIFYQFMTNNQQFNTNHDLLGYVDKDVEKYFAAKLIDADGKVSYKTMMNTDVWE